METNLINDCDFLIKSFLKRDDEFIVIPITKVAINLIYNLNKIHRKQVVMTENRLNSLIKSSSESITISYIN